VLFQLRKVLGKISKEVVMNVNGEWVRVQQEESNDVLYPSGEEQ
jgi:hypothetical protein